MFWTIVISLIIASAYLYINQNIFNVNKTVGDVGERIVCNQLKNLDASYQVFNSIENEIKYERLQIDHLVICDTKKVVYVIETKNYHGYFTGSPSSDKWANHIKGKVFYYENPVSQNRKHCKAVQDKYPNYKIESIVVFANNQVKWNCKNENIMRVDKLNDFILSH